MNQCIVFKYAPLARCLAFLILVNIVVPMGYGQSSNPSSGSNTGGFQAQGNLPSL